MVLNKNTERAAKTDIEDIGACGIRSDRRRNDWTGAGLPLDKNRKER